MVNVPKRAIVPAQAKSSKLWARALARLFRTQVQFTLTDFAIKSLASQEK